jgi:acetyl-CoA carboxylase carboxyltransferase component
MNYRTTINPASPDFLENQKKYEELSALLQTHLTASRNEGAEKHIAKAQQLGKMTARNRIEYILDEGSPFLELMPLAGLGIKGAHTVGSTAIAGLGFINGILCMVSANAGTIKSGSIDKVTLEKSLRLSEIAFENKLPVVYIVESSGANLPEQAQIFNFGGITFREITRRSRAGLPSISVVCGNSTAGGAYVPGMSDYSIFVKNQAKVFLAGPPLVKMATNEIVDEESLGGATMHSTVSGVSDFLAQNELEGLNLARKLLGQFQHKFPNAIPPNTSLPPVHSPEQLNGIVQTDVKKPFDIREVLLRIVDRSDFLEFKPDWGSTLVCAFAQIGGFPVGILGNNGVIFSESANKGAHFIQLCVKQNRPLLFLQNVTGFMVGKSYEEGGIIKDGAKLINAVSNAGVPAVTVLVGASFGAGNYAMCGRAYQPRFLFAYPNSKIAVMGGEQLSGVMDMIQREAAKKAGLPFDEQQAEFVKAMVNKQIDDESSAWYATARLWDDGIIEPRDTRNVLLMAYQAIYNAGWDNHQEFGVFRM